MISRKPEIIRLVQAGMNDKAIARQLGCQVEWVRSVARSCGLALARAPKPRDYDYAPLGDGRTEIIMGQNIEKYMAIIRESRA